MGSSNVKNNFNFLDIGIFIAIILFGILLYVPPLQSTSFYFDDKLSIEHNEAIKSIDIPKIFNAFNTRFLPGLSFAINYHFCALHPAGYRLTNLLIHCLNAFLVYLLVKLTLNLYLTIKPLVSGRLRWGAFFASMLFLCHPIQTESVNSITQRFVLMGSFFYLLTLFLYIQYRRSSKKRYMMGAIFSAIAAMFCKEFVVTLPLMLALYDFYFLDFKNETIWKRCRCLGPFFIIVLIVPFLLLKTPSEAIGVANIADANIVHEGHTVKYGNHIDITRARGGVNRHEYFLTELNVVCTYIRLLFIPINQNLDYDYPLSNEIDGKTFLSGVFLLCLLVLAVVMYKKDRLISFSILWFFLALSVESSFIPIGHVISEYRVYLASVGFCFLVMALVYMRQADQKLLNTIAIAIFIGFSILAYQRNRIWRDDFTLWNDTVLKSPHKARPYNNRGNAYLDGGNFTLAMLDYNKAIALNPMYAEAYINRGYIYAKQGDFSRAILDFSRNIILYPKNSEAYYDRGSAYFKEGDFTRSISDFSKALEINPKYTEALSGLDLGLDNRGITYAKEGHFNQAISDFTRAIEINPQDSDAYNNRGLTYDEKGNLAQAVSDLTQAIEINPDYANAYNNRAISYYHLKEYNQAWRDVHKAEELGYPVNPAFIKVLEKLLQ